MTAPPMLLLTTLALAQLATLGATQSARACSRCTWFLSPNGGQVPANLPGVSFSYHGPPLEGPPIMVTEIAPDGAELPLGVTLGGGAAMFDRPLVAGNTYRVRHPGCGEFLETTIRAAAAAPLPDSIGTITVDEAFDEERGVPTSSGACTTLVELRAARVAVVLSESARPWADALNFSWSVDQGIVAVVDSADTLTGAPVDWSEALAAQVCSSTDEFAPPTPPPTRVTLSARIPGIDMAIPSTSASLSLSCSDAQVPDVADDGGGCNGSSTVGCVSFLGVLAILIGSRRHRLTS